MSSRILADYPTRVFGTLAKDNPQPVSDSAPAPQAIWFEVAGQRVPITASGEFSFCARPIDRHSSEHHGRVHFSDGSVRPGRIETERVSLFSYNRLVWD